MSYASTGTLAEPESIEGLRQLFAAHGWTWVTGVSVMLLTLMHYPLRNDPADHQERDA